MNVATQIEKARMSTSATRPTTRQKLLTSSLSRVPCLLSLVVPSDPEVAGGSMSGVQCAPSHLLSEDFLTGSAYQPGGEPGPACSPGCRSVVSPPMSNPHRHLRRYSDPPTESRSRRKSVSRPSNEGIGRLIRGGVGARSARDGSADRARGLPGHAVEKAGGEITAGPAAVGLLPAWRSRSTRPSTRAHGGQHWASSSIERVDPIRCKSATRYRPTRRPRRHTRRTVGG